MAPQMFLLDAMQTFHFLLGAVEQLQITSVLLLNSYFGWEERQNIHTCKKWLKVYHTSIFELS
jgi:hypothetical protein